MLTHAHFIALLPRIVISACLCIVLQSCAINDLEDWPDDLPNVELFVKSWEADTVNQEFQELGVYLFWVRAFYQGNVAYPTGWRDVERIILEESGEQVDPVFSAELYDLGISIGSEWSKENPIRKIDNRMLSMWASILQIALGSNMHKPAVAQVSSDIKELFAGTLTGDQLTDARYEELLGLELFGGF